MQYLAFKNIFAYHLFIDIKCYIFFVDSKESTNMESKENEYLDPVEFNRIFKLASLTELGIYRVELGTNYVYFFLVHFSLLS